MQPVVVSWRLAGTTQRGAAPGLADLRSRRRRGQAGRNLRRAGAGEPEPQPSWWLGPVTARQQGLVTVVAGSGQPADRWAALVADAAAAVGRGLPAGVADGWSGRVVVEVPATPRDFAAVLGQSADAYAGIAAVAYQVGVGDRPPLRVVVNPRARSLVTPGAAGRDPAARDRAPGHPVPGVPGPDVGSRGSGRVGRRRRRTRAAPAPVPPTCWPRCAGTARLRRCRPMRTSRSGRPT